MRTDVYYEMGLWKFDLDEHTTLVHPDKTELEEQMDFILATASRREEV